MLQILLDLEMSCPQQYLLTEEADIHLFGDDTSRDTVSYGEAGASVTDSVNNKPGSTIGGQNIILINVN